MSDTQDQAERFLKMREWKVTHDCLDCVVYEPLGNDFTWQVAIDKRDNWMEVRKFTDSDIQVQDVGAVATPRWVTEAECRTLAELTEELTSLGVIPWECPYCGESGGKPVTTSWDEFQGCAEHGGVVTFTEERCTKCERRG